VRARIALLFLACSAAASAQQLGTLFMSPAERERLDRQRRGEAVQAAGGQAAAETREPVLTGFVKRSDGKSTVFLDKRPYPVRDAKIGQRLDPRIVERFDPLPEPPDLPVEDPKPAEPPVAASKGSRQE